MDRPDVFMPLYIGDYLAGTSRLTTELHGAYMLLIMDYWMNGALPDDDSALASITKMPIDAWSIARAKLEQFFSIENGVWKHKRIEQELANAIEKKAKAADKASKAAIARWNKDKKDAPSINQAMLNECPSPSPSPSPSGDIKTSTSESPTHDPVDPLLNCPHRSIIEIYHRILPELPRVLDTTWKGSSREKDLQARWRHDKRHQNLDFWEAYFEGVARSKFHLGDNNRGWKADLGWLVKRSNFDKMVERIQAEII